MDFKEDKDLIKLCLSGDIESFSFIIQKYQARVINTCLKYTKNLQDAEDVAQEVFLKAYQSLDTFKFESKFYSWLYRIAVNTCLNYINSKEKRTERETISDISCLNDVKSTIDNPQDYYDIEELKSLVIPMYEELPTDLREILKMYEFEDNTYEEISEKLSLPMGTVRSRLHRARNMLLSNFEKLIDEEE